MHINIQLKLYKIILRKTFIWVFYWFLNNNNNNESLIVFIKLADPLGIALASKPQFYLQSYISFHFYHQRVHFVLHKPVSEQYIYVTIMCYFKIQDNLEIEPKRYRKDFLNIFLINYATIYSSQQYFL